MPSRKPARRVRDIIDNIATIHHDIARLTEADFLEDRLVQDAVLYRLLRISEAATKLGDNVDELVPGPPWVQIRAFGNVLRHDYDTVSLPQVWTIIVRDLPLVSEACTAALARMKNGE